jgi:geranylgeranyl pyrophosphate synthase
MIIDDIEDGSTVRRGGPAVHRLCGVPLALNAGNWMYFAPLALLPTLGLAPAAELHLHRRIGRVLLDCHYGQALDLGAQLGATPPEEVGDLVATLSLLKTGRLVGLCAELGAVAAGADEGRRTAIVDFGEALGVGLQMLDDLGNLAPTQDREKRHEDLRQGRVTWAWSWAAALDADRFAALVAERERLQARGDAPWAELAARLRGLVEAHGRRQAHHHLHQALARLRADLGASARRSLDALARELQRLEASYG